MVPTRRTYLWLAIATMAFAVYASLLPFELKGASFDAAWAEFLTVMTGGSRDRLSRTNFLANVLLFVPIGFGLAGALLADGSRRLSVIPATLVIVPTSLSVSLAAEFLQVFATGRVCSRLDVIAQTVGSLVGIIAWAIGGQEITGWIRASQSRGRTDRLARAVTAYAALWIFVNLAPFDITVDLGVLGSRMRRGLIAVVPFSGLNRAPSRLAWDALAATLSAVPLGLLGLVGWAGREARRSTAGAFAVGAGLVAAMEVAQVFIRSHAADTTDVLFGWAGVALGVWIGSRTLGRHRAIRISARLRAAPAWGVAALLAWCLVLVAYHWRPYDFALDSDAINRKLAGMSLVPFAGYSSGPDLTAFNNLLVKVGVSMPIGVIAAFVVRGGASAMRTMAWLIAATLVFGAIELGQLFLPTRSPDPSDVLVGVAGATAGLLLGRWLQPD